MAHSWTVAYTAEVICTFIVIGANYTPAPISLCHFICFSVYLVRIYGYVYIYVCMYVICGCVGECLGVYDINTIKRKSLIGMTLNLTQ